MLWFIFARRTLSAEPAFRYNMHHTASVHKPLSLLQLSLLPTFQSRCNGPPISIHEHIFSRREMEYPRSLHARCDRWYQKRKNHDLPSTRLISIIHYSITISSYCHKSDSLQDAPLSDNSDIFPLRILISPIFLSISFQRLRIDR